MGIPVPWLIFALFDGALAYCIIYNLLKAWWKGKSIGRILGIILGTICFIVYIVLFVLFQTKGSYFGEDFRNIIYFAPIVLAVLLIILVLLCQPPKKEDKNEEEPNGDEQSDTKETTI